MATRTSTSIFFANDTTAHFRAWAQEIHDALTAFGWVQTADTGQINLTTVVPSGVSLPQGYEVWRMNDALQSTYPVFMKIEYGTGNPVANPTIWVTLGTGSNGAGTLTGPLSVRQIYAGSADATRANAYYSSGDTNRFCMAWGSDPLATTQNSFLYLGVERSKNSDGTDANDAVYLMGIGGASAAFGGAYRSQYLPFTGPIPAQEVNGPSYPSGNNFSLILGGITYTLPIYPISVYPRNAIMNFAGYMNSDFTREVPITLIVYGANHTYLPLGTAGSNFVYANAGSWQNACGGSAGAPRAMMRYE